MCHEVKNVLCKIKKTYAAWSANVTAMPLLLGALLQYSTTFGKCIHSIIVREQSSGQAAVNVNN
jgi:hypothetical protein